MSIEIRRTGLDSFNVLSVTDSAVDELARAAIANAIETSLDMIIDCAEEYPTKLDVERVLNGANEQALYFIEDAIDELKAALIKRLKSGKLTVKVTAMRYNDDGEFTDADCKVKFE